MPPFVSWAEALSTQMVGEDLWFCPTPKRIGLNLSDDLLFFWSSPNFGQKVGLNLSENLFFCLHLILGKKLLSNGEKFWAKNVHLDLCFSQIF